MAGNRMVEKSKRAIKDALLDLMYTKDFNEITVNELLVKANISRGTFYAHFNNLEDVRQQLVNDLYAHADEIFCDFKASDLAKDPRAAMLTAAEMMIQSRDPAKRVFKFINVYGLASELKDWLANYILEDELIVKQFGGMQKAKPYADFIAGGVMHAYNIWIQEDFTISAEEFVDYLSNILMGGLSKVLNPEITE